MLNIWKAWSFFKKSLLIFNSMLFPHLGHLSYHFNLCFLEGTCPWAVLTGNLFSAWFLLGFGEVVELGASPILLGICLSVGGPVLLLGGWGGALLASFNEEWLSLLNQFPRCWPALCLSQGHSGCHCWCLSVVATLRGSHWLISLDKSCSPPWGPVHHPAPPGWLRP